MNGDEVRKVKLWMTESGYFMVNPGYDVSDVNDLFVRIAAELDAGRPAGPLIANAKFRKRYLRGIYETGPVDWFLDQLRHREDEAARADVDPWRDLAADPYCIRSDLDGLVAAPSPQKYAEAWRDFQQPPGTRLSWVSTGALRRELRTTDLRTVAAVRYGRAKTLSIGGRTYTFKIVTRFSWRGIAGTISPDQPGIPAHTLKPQTSDRPRSQLLDETGRPILYTARQHYDHRARGYIKFPGQRWLRFPVRGTETRNAIMTAVDQAGNKVARYRLTGSRRPIEIIAHPGLQLTDELALALVVSAPWLRSFFRQSGGGG